MPDHKSDFESCPVVSCAFKGQIQRVLCHIRQSHDANDIPDLFVSRLNLSKCHHCLKLFAKLGQHLSQCKKKLSCSTVGFEFESVSSQCPSNLSPSSKNAHALPTFEAPLTRGVLPETYTSSASPSRETEAWEYIRSLSSEEILKMIPARTVQKIKPAMKANFLDCCSVAFRKIRNDPTDETGWKLLLLIPRMVLQPLTRGGKAKLSVMQSMYKQFRNFQWEDLLSSGREDTKKGNAKANSRDHVKRAALSLVRCGELSRAARVLTSSGLAPATPDTAQKLAEKHPIRVFDIPDMPSPAMHISLSKQHMFNSIKKSPRGSGCGPSGWRYEHLKVIASDTVSAEQLHFAFYCIANGSVPVSIARLLSSARLIALPKASGDVRPIAIGEVFTRITAKCICAQMKSEFSNFFSPLQHGVSTEGGTDLLLHHIQLLLEANNDWIVLKTDAKNAFNSIHRSHLLQQVMKSFPTLTNHVMQMYSGFGPLVFLQNNIPVILSSQEGIHQGDPLGPVLFSLGIQQTLVDLQSNFQAIRVLAYLDDVFLVGPAKHVLDAFSTLQPEFFKIGLEIQETKCEIYCSYDKEDTFSSEYTIPVSSEGIVILGTPIGKREYVARACSTIAEKGNDLCRQLVDLDNVQASMLLLRYCHTTRLNHLARGTCPETLAQAATIHDKQTKSTFSCLLGNVDISGNMWKQATLPVRLGGFSMTSLNEVAPFAFAASWAHSLKLLPDRFPVLQDQVNSLVTSSNHASDIGLTLEHHLKDISTLSDLLPNTKKLQHRLTTEFVQSKAD